MSLNRIMLSNYVNGVSSYFSWKQMLFPNTIHYHKGILNNHRQFGIQRREESTTTEKRIRSDPTSKRPNKICDPYGQGGKPLSLIEVEKLKGSISNKWTIEFRNDERFDEQQHNQILDNDEEVEKQQHEDTQQLQYPFAIIREFIHPDYISGSRFIQKIAAIAQMNDHYPHSLRIDRRIYKKNWQIVSYCQCHTFVLNGLSTNDFHIAMVS